MVLMLIDLIVVNGAYYASVLLHFYFDLPPEKYEMLVARIPYVTIIYIGLFLVARLYRNLWRYMGFLEVTKTVICAGFGTLFTFIMDYIFMKVSKMFKTYTGMSPSEYAKSCRKA